MLNSVRLVQNHDAKFATAVLFQALQGSCSPDITYSLQHTLLLTHHESRPDTIQMWFENRACVVFMQKILTSEPSHRLC